MHTFYAYSSSLSVPVQVSVAVEVFMLEHFIFFLPRRLHIQCTMMLSVELCALLEEREKIYML